MTKKVAALYSKANLINPAELGFFESYMDDASLLKQFTDVVNQCRLQLKDGSMVIRKFLPKKASITIKSKANSTYIGKEKPASNDVILSDRQVMINDIKKTVNITSILKNYNKVKHLVKSDDIDFYKEDNI